MYQYFDDEEQEYDDDDLPEDEEFDEDEDDAPAESARDILKGQVKQALVEKGKQYIKEKLSKEAIKYAAKAILTNPYVLGAIAILVVIILLILLAMTAIKGEKSAQAAERKNAINVTDEAKAYYKEVQRNSYSKETETDHSYIDEQGLALPWSVMAQMDSVLFNGNGTSANFSRQGPVLTSNNVVATKDMLAVIKKLQPRYDVQRVAYDTYAQYKWTEVSPPVIEEGNVIVPAQYDWKPVGSKEIKRHIIEKATTWEGVVTRKYTKELTADQRKSMTSPAPGDIAEVRYEWIYEADPIQYDFKKIFDFYKQVDPDVWESTVWEDIATIKAMADEDVPVEEGYRGQFDTDLGLDPNYMYTQGEYAWPLSFDHKTITSSFGMRSIPERTGMHEGIDIDSEIGDTVYPTKAGKVAAIYPMFGGGGKTIMIDHGVDSKGKRITSFYMHLNKFLVKAGDEVTPGKPIAQAGDTGSGGSHLHFQIEVDKVPVDPIKFAGFNVRFTDSSAPGGDRIKWPGNDHFIFIPPTGGTGKAAPISGYSEVELVARVAYAEAAGSGWTAMRGVAETVRNRMNSPLWRYPKSPSSLVSNPSQYNAVTELSKRKPSASELQTLTKIVEEVFQGKSNVAAGSQYFLGSDIIPRGSQGEARFMAPGGASSRGLDFIVTYSIPERKGKGATSFYRIKGTK